MNRILVGDSLEIMRTLQSGIVHTCVTSPPYWGMRDYGVSGQLGLEDTPAEYISNLVTLFGEVKRVLRDDGTLWVNIGDTYVGATSQHKSGGSAGNTSCISKKTMSGIPQNGRGARNKYLMAHGWKMKDLVGIPWMLATALRNDGWYLRMDIIWNKPNPKPESVRDRPTLSHEYIFFLSKSSRYYYDADSIMEATVDGHGRKNKRSVWDVNLKPYKGAHFATFPVDLVIPCILAGCPIGGVVLDPFFGAGTTGLAAYQQGRSYIGIELNPEYADTASRRIEGKINAPL